MKKAILLGLVVLLTAIALTGCEWLLAPRVEDVKAEDLGSYSASKTIATDENSVLQAMGSAGDGAGSGPGTIFENQVAGKLGFSVQGSDFEAVFNGLVQHSIDTARSSLLDPARSVTVTDDSDTSDPNNPEIDLTIEITDETVNGTDLSPSGTGSATIESFYLTVSGSGTETTTTASFEAEGEQEGVFTWTNWNDGYSSATIHDGQVNSKGDGRIEVDIEQTGTDTNPDIAGSLFWRFGYAMNAGFSFSDSSTNEGGKITVNFRYWGREDINFDSSADLEDQAQGSFEAEMTIKVYDNDDKLLEEHTYTDEDVYGTSTI